MFSLWYLSNGEDVSGLIEFTDVGGLLLDSNKRFSSLKQEISQNLLYSAMDLYRGGGTHCYRLGSAVNACY